MSSIITDIRVIKPEHWMQEFDGVWYVHIPFDTKGSKDVLMEFVDPDDYIQEHKVDFDALNSGTTTDTECIITADHRPNCDMSVQLKFCEDEDGEIVYKPNDKGQFIPEWRSNKSGFGFPFGMLGGMGMPQDIIDAASKTIESETPQADEKKIII